MADVHRCLQYAQKYLQQAQQTIPKALQRRLNQARSNPHASSKAMERVSDAQQLLDEVHQISVTIQRELQTVAYKASITQENINKIDQQLNPVKNNSPATSRPHCRRRPRRAKPKPFTIATQRNQAAIRTTAAVTSQAHPPAATNGLDTTVSTATPHSPYDQNFASVSPRTIFSFTDLGYWIRSGVNSLLVWLCSVANYVAQHTSAAASVVLLYPHATFWRHGPATAHGGVIDTNNAALNPMTRPAAAF